MTRFFLVSMAAIDQVDKRIDKEKQPFSLDSTDGVLPSHSGHEDRHLAMTYFKSSHVFETRQEAQDNKYLRTTTDLSISLVFDLIQIQT